MNSTSSIVKRDRQAEPAHEADPPPAAPGTWPIWAMTLPIAVTPRVAPAGCRAATAGAGAADIIEEL